MEKKFCCTVGQRAGGCCHLEAIKVEIKRGKEVLVRLPFSCFIEVANQMGGLTKIPGLSLSLIRGEGFLDLEYFAENGGLERQGAVLASFFGGLVREFLYPQDGRTHYLGQLKQGADELVESPSEILSRVAASFPN